MENKKYVCVKDYQNSDFMLGQARTLEQWKQWLLKNRIDALYDISVLFDKKAMETFHALVDMDEKECLSYLQDTYEIKLIPLENSNYKYIDVDEHKLLTDADLKTILLNLEHGDLLDNIEDYTCGHLSIDTWCQCVKMCLSNDVEWILRELDMFGYYIVKIQ